MTVTGVERTQIARVTELVSVDVALARVRDKPAEIELVFDTVAIGVDDRRRGVGRFETVDLIAPREQQQPSPQRSVYIRFMLTRADDLAKLTVLDEYGKTVELGTLWRDKTAVLVFIRHFG